MFLTGQVMMSMIFLCTISTTFTLSLVLGDWRIFLGFLGGFIIVIGTLIAGIMKGGAIPENAVQKGATNKGLQRSSKMDDIDRSAGAIIGEIVGSIKT